jgi:hypothetical protein
VKKIFVVSVIFLSLAATRARAFDLFSHPEIAAENSLFFNASIISYQIPPDVWNVTVPKFKLSADYVTPWIAPVFFGLYMEAPVPNLTSFGTRAGYHFNMDVDNLDIYFMWCFDFGFLRRKTLESYGVEVPEIRYFDFRGGMRYVFGKLFGLYIESDYKLNAILLGVTIKLN